MSSLLKQKPFRFSDKNHPDAPLAYKEAERLSQYIDSQYYYRYGNCIFDPWRFRPLYTISEFAWSFTNQPSLAPMTAIYLSELLEDIPRAKDMKIITMIKVSKDYFDRFEQIPKDSNGNSLTESQRKNMKAKVISQMFRFYFQKNYIKNVVLPTRKKLDDNYNLYTAMKKKLLELHDDHHWLPAMDFYNKIFKKEE